MFYVVLGCPILSVNNSLQSPRHGLHQALQRPWTPFHFQPSDLGRDHLDCSGNSQNPPQGGLGHSKLAPDFLERNLCLPELKVCAWMG
jgi:hypothetical protein